MLSILGGWRELIKEMGRIFDTVEKCVVSHYQQSSLSLLTLPIFLNYYALDSSAGVRNFKLFVTET